MYVYFSSNSALSVLNPLYCCSCCTVTFVSIVVSAVGLLLLFFFALSIC